MNSERNKWLAILFSGFIFILSLLFLNSYNLSSKGRIVIAIMFFSIILWLLKPIPYSIAGILGLLIMYFLRVDSFSNLFSGFSSKGWFFFLGVLILGHTISKTEIGKKITIIILFISRGNKLLLAIYLPFMLMIQALIMPSATARTTILSPIFTETLKNYRLKQNEGFSKYIMLNLGVLNPISSSAYLSGGASAIIAGEIINNYGIGINWLTWMAYLWLPITLIIIISSYSLFFVYNYHSLRIIKLSNSEHYQIKPLSFTEKYVLFIVSIVIILWILGSFISITPAVPALIGVVLLYLPSFGICNVKDLRNIDWDLIIFIGVSLSLANLLISTGAGKWLAEHITYSARTISTGNLYFIYTSFGFLVLIRLIFPSSTTYNACVLPAMLAVSVNTEINLVNIAFTTILAGTISFFPIQSISSLIMFERNYYKITDTVITGFILLFSTFLVIILAINYYWPYL